ncbi:MAG: acyltransferase [Clostridium sp.]|nr:acyltransferase [Clostridium sp.]
MIILKAIFHLIAIIKKVFYKIIFRGKVKFGKGFTFRKGFSISIEGQGKIQVGKDVFFNNYCSLNSLDSITIGDDCIFGSNIQIYDHNHRFKDKEKGIMEQGYTKAPIKIGTNCWIGSNVTILKGVTIGDNVIIGAGCVIDKDIPNNVIVRQNGNLIMEERR